MNLNQLLSSAANGQGIDALARQYGVTPDQARQVAEAALPALSAGLKRKARSPEGMTEVAGLIRATDVEAAADAPEADPAAAEAQGARFLDQLFGPAKGAVEQQVSADAATRAGVDQSLISRMLPMIAAMVLGAAQKRESTDSGLSGLVGALLQGGGAGGSESGGLGGLMGAMTSALGGGSSGAQSGGGDLSALTAMFDADGDGSVMDDLLERFMR